MISSIMGGGSIAQVYNEMNLKNCHQK